MSPLLPFKGCWDRIDRAETHSDAFAHAWNKFVEAEPYSPVLNIENDGTGTISMIQRYESLPDIFAFEFGEMLYQLRAALDSCIYASAIQESKRNPPPNEKDLAFPICNSEIEFKNAAWKIAPLSEERRGIVEQVQPYKTPDLAPELMVRNFNRTLQILNDWARKDRHRKLHMTGSWASRASPKLRLPTGCNLVSIHVVPDGFFENEYLVASFRLDGFIPGMKVQANPDLAIDIAVNEPPDPCADNDTLGERIRSMIFATKTIVRSLEESFIEQAT